MSKTLRIKYPNWQGGNRPLYYVGAQILSLLLPHNKNQKEVEIKIVAPTEEMLNIEQGIVGRTVIQNSLEEASQLIELESPDKIITIGGDCLVSQAPFDYLHGKYGDELGIIWIDAHPDISNPDIFHHAHAMVLANLLHYGDPALSELVKNPFHPKQVLYLGLQNPTNDERVILQNLGIRYDLRPNELNMMEQFKLWIEQNQFKKVVIHLDLDVLNPKSFNSLYFNNPQLADIPDNAAVGQMGVETLVAILTSINQQSEIVGLTVAEYLPWDAQYLKTIFETIDIFKG